MEGRSATARGRLATLALAIALVILSVYTLISLPVLFYSFGVSKFACTDPTELLLHERTLFIGDLHILSSKDAPRFEALRGFLLSERITNLIILGDLFDSPGVYAGLSYQFGGPEAAQRSILGILNLRGLRIAVFLLIGSPAHDPQSLSFQIQVEDVDFRTVGKCASVRGSGLELFALHGDQAFTGHVAFGLSWVLGPLVLEREWKTQMGLARSTWVIMAHTHWPGVDYEARVANTGGWLDIPIVYPPTGMGIIVEGSELRLVQIAS